MTKPLKTFTVKVPTKTYLRKFFNRLYGSTIPLTWWDPLGTFVLSLLEKESFNINMNSEKKRWRMSYNTDEIVFSATFKTLNYKGHAINPDKFIAINRYMEDVFAEKLYQYCFKKTVNKTWRPGYIAAINEFAESCGIIIDQDISLDALKQAEYRYRKRQEQILQTFVTQKKLPMGNGNFNKYLN